MFGKPNLFREIARQYGDIQADDTDAVVRFFKEELSQLPEETRLKITEIIYSTMFDETDRQETLPDNPTKELAPFPKPSDYQALNDRLNISIDDEIEDNELSDDFWDEFKRHLDT